MIKNQNFECAYLAPRMKMVDLQCRITMMVNSPVEGTGTITPWDEVEETGADD